MADPLKLTKKQIENWRAIFINMGLTMAVFLDDEQMTILVKKMQDRLNEAHSPKLDWEIKIRTYEDAGIDFDKINVEPKKISATIDTIVLSCMGLFTRHPKIEAILVNVPGTTMSHVIERKDLKKYGEDRSQ